MTTHTPHYTWIILLSLWASAELHASPIVPGLYVTVNTGIVEIDDGGQHSFASGIAPTALASDELTLFAAEASTGNLYFFAPDGTQSTYASGLNGPSGVAKDGSGNVWVSEATTNQVVEIDPGGGQTLFFTGVSPSFMAFDSLGDLFVSDNLSGDILEIAVGGSESFFAFGIVNPTGLAIDHDDNVYVGSGDGSIYKFDTLGNQTTFATGLTNPQGLAFDRFGNLFAADATTNAIYEFTPGGAQSTFATGLDGPSGIVFAAPEPGSYWLAAIGLAALGWRKARKRRER